MVHNASWVLPQKFFLLKTRWKRRESVSIPQKERRVPESTIENCQAISIVSISILTHPYESYIFIYPSPPPFTLLKLSFSP